MTGEGSASAGRRSRALVPPPSGALERDRAAVLLGHLLHDREAEPRARHLARCGGAVEAVEHVGEVDVVDARPMIANDHLTAGHGDLDRGRRRAPLDGVVEQVRDRAVEPGRHAADDRRLRVQRDLDLRRQPSRALHGVLHELVELHLRRLQVGRPVGRDLDEVRDEAAHLLELAHHVGEQRGALLLAHGGVAREHLDVRAQARQRRAQLVRRVRDELTLRLVGDLERRQHRVEARAEPGELVAAVDVDPVREILRLGDDLGLARQATHGLQRRARDEPAEQGRDADPADREEDQDQADPVQQPVDVVDRADELEGVPVVRGHRQHPHVHVRDGRVREEALPLAARGRQRLLLDRQLDEPGVLLDHRAVRPDGLDDDAGQAEARLDRGRAGSRPSQGRPRRAQARA
ncbi:MAG: hypothetical protein R3C15_00160 [Thermoleophilia bacterium]